MADVAFWERKFVELYVVGDKRERYLSFLKGRKHRKKVLERLNHNLDFNQAVATEIPGAERTAGALAELLRRNHVNSTCYLMADGCQADGRELRVELALAEFLSNFWGSVLICPPKPIALYKEEDIGSMYLLGGRAA